MKRWMIFLIGFTAFGGTPLSLAFWVQAKGFEVLWGRAVTVSLIMGIVYGAVLLLPTLRVDK